MEVYGLTGDPSLQHAAERSPVKMPKPVDLSVLGLRPSECLTVLGSLSIRWRRLSEETQRHADARRQGLGELGGKRCE
jgi:hypothetical protein